MNPESQDFPNTDKGRGVGDCNDPLGFVDFWLIYLVGTKKIAKWQRLLAKGKPGYLEEKFESRNPTET